MAAAVLALALASCKDSDSSSETTEPKTVVTLNVDVILPADIQKLWTPTFQDALDNIAAAQKGMEKQVKLNLRYHDEDKENLTELTYNLLHPQAGKDGKADTCHAIIGPYHSVNARAVLDRASNSRLPVLMPTCSSAELQRSEARQTNSFFFTESDVTQCEVLLSAVSNFGYKNVALLYSDDTYGQSFRNWFGFEATQMGLTIVPGGIGSFKDAASTETFIRQISVPSGDISDYYEQVVALVVALGNANDYLTVGKALQTFRQTEDGASLSPPDFFFADTADADAIYKAMIRAYGTSPVASASDGYDVTYYIRHNADAPAGSAQLYDALCVLALGRSAQLHAPNPDELTIDGMRVQYESAPKGPVLSDWIRFLISRNMIEKTHWTTYGLTEAFNNILIGKDFDLTGASGDLNFDKLTHTSILNTNYELWSTMAGSPYTVGIYSTAGVNSTLATTSLWEWQATIAPIDDIAPADGAGKGLPERTDLWAVIVSPSTTWRNYRHQADAFAMYQLLKRYGYDDDHIVLIVEDNLKDSKENVSPFTGKIFVALSSEETESTLADRDVRRNAVVDYHFSDLNGPDDIADIMLGRQSQRLPQVIHPTKTSNVFFFWSGHGTATGGPLWGNEDSYQAFDPQRLKNIVTQMNQQQMYRRMMITVEACFGGQWGEAVNGLPNVLLLSAANANETSKADIFNQDLHTFLSNAFTRVYRNMVEENPNLTVRDLYYSLAQTTSGSHVTLYNVSNYGSVMDARMGEYFVKIED